MKNNRLASVAATIANNTSLSPAINLNGNLPVAIKMPARWNTASITFQGSMDNSTFSNLYLANGTEYSITAAVNNLIILPTSDFQGIGNYMKIRSNTSGAAVAQIDANGTIVTVITREEV